MADIWIVDDQPVFHTQYATWLTAAPCSLEIRVFGSIPEVDLAVGANPAPRGLLLDEKLNEVSGTCWLRGHPDYFRHTRIWVVSAFCDARMSFDAALANATLQVKPAPYEFFVHVATTIKARAASMRKAGLSARLAARVADFAERWGLTVRQTEIVALFVGGLRAKHIADELNIALDTVQQHVKRILRRCHLADMREVVDEIKGEDD